ncbi:PTS transporter subunit EIIC [Klebsiella pneumoniae]|uniref:PTS transporter subunit EIIC n=1 Tax=Klebsiella pneumoniae TaxID=573 RepID=UPI002867F44F|nr:PTS transporter subunit EIIC [Klebsiella pneumoniae]
MSSLYQSMIAVIEQSITPLAGRLGQQKYVIAIRDGFTAALPFMIIGSFMLVFIFPPFSPDTTNGFARGWLDFSQHYREQLMLPFNLSMGVMTFFISVGIGASLGRQFQLDPVMSGLLAFMAFLLVAAPYADGKISTQYLSGQGIFTALITAIYSTRVYAWLKQNNITIRLPKEVPTGVARSFEILIPVLVVIATLHPLNLFPYIYLVLLNLVGVAVGIWRFMYGPENEILTVWVSIVWVFYNLIILGGAVAVSVESKQVRRSHRVEMSMPAAIAREDGHLFSCTVHDYSDGGLGIKINGDAQVLEGQNARLLLKRGQQEYAFPVRVARVNGSEVGLQLLPLTNQQHIDFVQCTFARADTWALWQDSFPEDKPMESLLDILKLGFRGYRHLAEFSPPSVKVVFRALTSLVAWIASFVPRRPERAAPTLSADPAMAQQ